MTGLCVVGSAAKSGHKFVLAPDGVIDIGIHADSRQRAILLCHESGSLPLALPLRCPCEGLSRRSTAALEFDEGKAGVSVNNLDHSVFAGNEQAATLGVERQTRWLTTLHHGIVAVILARSMIQNVNGVRGGVGDIDVIECATGDLTGARA